MVLRNICGVQNTTTLAESFNITTGLNTVRPGRFVSEACTLLQGKAVIKYHFVKEMVNDSWCSDIAL